MIIRKDMEMGKTEKRINEIVKSGKGVFLGLIDPDKGTADGNVRLAKLMKEGGADIIMLGGSTGVKGKKLEDTAKGIKENVKLPLHIFPGDVANITKHADSIYFMSLLNSKNPYWISRAQARGAPVIKELGMEAIPTAYLVFEPGQTVGRVGEADLLSKKDPEKAVSYCIAAEMMGMRFVILESGSGAPEPVSPEMVKAIRKATGLKVIVAGGVKTPEQARDLVKAGAHGIHIGTKIEQADSPLERIKEFARAIHLE